MADDEWIIRTSEAAAYIGVHPDTLRRWAREGLVKPAFVSPGGHYKWDKTRLKGPLGEPCCDLARTLMTSHGWWNHDHMVTCDQCGAFRQVLRPLLDGSHICTKCDVSWPFDKDWVAVHE